MKLLSQQLLLAGRGHIGLLFEDVVVLFCHILRLFNNVNTKIAKIAKIRHKRKMSFWVPVFVTLLLGYNSNYLDILLTPEPKEVDEGLYGICRVLRRRRRRDAVSVWTTYELGSLNLDQR